MFASQIPSRAGFSPLRLVSSALLHSALLLLAVSLRFSPSLPPATRSVKHITLLAPAPILVPELPVVRPAVSLPSAPHVPTRAFAAPRLTVPLPAHPAPVELSLPDQPVASAPAIEPLRTPTALPPPPVIVGKLSSANAAPSSAPSASLRATGFSTPANRDAPEPARVTRSAGFGEASISAATYQKASAVAPAPTAVEILSKPRPLYTEEARRLRIEGEVVLEVLFASTGSARVERILRGLGHGLDEAAVESAMRIEFRPALRAGQPVDQTATVHITFQLAY